MRSLEERVEKLENKRMLYGCLPLELVVAALVGLVIAGACHDITGHECAYESARPAGEAGE